MDKFSENTAEKIWAKYQQGVAYKRSIELYDTVDENEDFFVGRQWGDLETKAPDLDKPVINFLQRVVSYFVSNITTDAIGTRFRFFNMPKEQSKELERIISAQLEQAIEYNDLNVDSKDAVRDAAVDGDACYHIWFDAEAESGQDAKGLVKIERIPNTDVYFGNRQQPDPEEQPYIIIASRKMLDEVKELAKQMGGRADEIQPDSGDYENELQQQDNDKRVTVLTCYYRKNGSIHRIMTAQSGIVAPDTDMGYKLYPIAWMPWERQKGSYHGVSCVTALIPNQIAINKIFAMSLKQQRDLAYPKIIYDGTQFPNGWKNGIGAVEVTGDPREAAVALTPSADIPNSVFTMANSLLSQSREMMGASDASLGNINPDNTSAIIAVQNATAMPLELKKREYQRLIEKVVRSMLDIISTDYGTRSVLVSDELGNEQEMLFNWESLKTVLYKLSCDIGDINYWDPKSQAQMLENLWGAGMFKDANGIPDAVMFLEHMPDGLLKDKERLIAELKEAKNNAMSVMQNPNAIGAAGAGAGGLPMPAMPQGI